VDLMPLVAVWMQNEIGRPFSGLCLLCVSMDRVCPRSLVDCKWFLVVTWLGGRVVVCGGGWAPCLC
jgi:hypothetical protein